MTVIQVQTWKRLRSPFPYKQEGLKIITGVNWTADSNYLMVLTTSAGVMTPPIFWPYLLFITCPYSPSTTSTIINKILYYCHY